METLRAECKAWEKSFKASNNRVPTPDDIKQVPGLAAKYKQYKAYTKAAASKQNPPSTPPRSVINKPRAGAQSAALPESYNPFSPVKNKGKQREQPTTGAKPNPFATPVKRRSKPRSPSVEGFRAIAEASTSTDRVAQGVGPTAAVSRARKRLRGESVSPSPRKDKRKRLGAHSAFAQPASKESDSEQDGDDLPKSQYQSSVDDSPVKPATGGKSFKLLFDESPRMQSLSVSLSKLDGKPKPLFDVEPAKKRKSTIAKLFGNVLPSIDDLYAETPTSPPVLAPPVKPNLGSRRSSKKHVLSDVEEDIVMAPPSKPRQPVGPVLLPPSPKPADNRSNRYNAKGRDDGKGKAKPKATNHKKAKMDVDGEPDEEGAEDQSDTEAATVKFAAPRRPPVLRTDEDDPEAELIPPAARTNAGKPQLSGAEKDGGTVEVNLPNQMRNLLALSPSKRYEHDEARLVNGLLYGGHRGHYDDRRGEIWGIGDEQDEPNGNAEDEDEWEGEGVPWEVGEL